MDLITNVVDSTLTRSSVFMTGLVLGYILEDQLAREWLRIRMARACTRVAVAALAALYSVHLIGFTRWPLQSAVGAHCYASLKHLISPLLAYMLALFYFENNRIKIVSFLSQNIFYLLNFFTPIVNIFHFLVMFLVLDQCYSKGIRIETIDSTNVIRLVSLQLVFFSALIGLSVIITFVFYMPLNAFENYFIKSRIKYKKY